MTGRWEERSKTYLSLLLALALSLRLGLLLADDLADALLAQFIVLWVSLEVLVGNLALDDSGANLFLELGKVATHALSAVLRTNSDEWQGHNIKLTSSHRSRRGRRNRKRHHR